jgi:hypothetical protein
MLSLRRLARSSLRREELILDYGCISVERCFSQRAPAPLIPRIHIGALIEKITNCIESPLARRQQQRRTATAFTVDSGTGICSRRMLRTFPSAAARAKCVCRRARAPGNKLRIAIESNNVLKKRLRAAISR